MIPGAGLQNLVADTGGRDGDVGVVSQPGEECFGVGDIPAGSFEDELFSAGFSQFFEVGEGFPHVASGRQAARVAGKSAKENRALFFREFNASYVLLVRDEPAPSFENLRPGKGGRGVGFSGFGRRDAEGQLNRGRAGEKYGNAFQALKDEL
jgi:hypothetical protein